MEAEKNTELRIVDDSQTESESEITDTSHSKGKKLEEEFSFFMKEKLGWSSVRVGAHMAGKSNVKGAAIDVIGERLDKRGILFFMWCKIWLGIGILFLIYGIWWAVKKWDNEGLFFLVFSILFMIGSIFFIRYSDKYYKENAWVECKNLKGKVNINQMDKSVREYNDYVASNNKEYKFTTHYFVSTNGYVENALKHAFEHNVICYHKENGEFIKTKYWE